MRRSIAQLPALIEQNAWLVRVKGALLSREALADDLEKGSPRPYDAPTLVSPFTHTAADAENRRNMLRRIFPSPRFPLFFFPPAGEIWLGAGCTRAHTGWSEATTGYEDALRFGYGSPAEQEGTALARAEPGAILRTVDVENGVEQREEETRMGGHDDALLGAAA